MQRSLFERERYHLGSLLSPFHISGIIHCVTQTFYCSHVDNSDRNIVNNIYRYIFRENLRNGEEVGSSFAAHYEGEPLVDIWGGYADVDTRRPWTKDTLSIIFSATKGVTAILAALFVDR